jgi:hypothetical protein
MRLAGLFFRQCRVFPEHRKAPQDPLNLGTNGGQSLNDFFLCRSAP